MRVRLQAFEVSLRIAAQLLRHAEHGSAVRPGAASCQGHVFGFAHLLGDDRGMLDDALTGDGAAQARSRSIPFARVSSACADMLT
jgi:hypothetical protein